MPGKVNIYGSGAHDDPFHADPVMDEVLLRVEALEAQVRSMPVCKHHVHYGKKDGPKSCCKCTWRLP